MNVIREDIKPGVTKGIKYILKKTCRLILDITGTSLPAKSLEFSYCSGYGELAVTILRLFSNVGEACFFAKLYIQNDHNHRIAVLKKIDLFR